MSYRENVQTQESLQVFLKNTNVGSPLCCLKCVSIWIGRQWSLNYFRNISSKYLERLRQEEIISRNLQTWAAAARVVMELLTSGTECSSVLLTSDCPTAWQSKMCLIVRRVRWLLPLLVLCLLLRTCECKLTQLRPTGRYQVGTWRFKSSGIKNRGVLGGALCSYFQEDDGGSSKTLVTIYQSTRRRVLGHLNLHQLFRKNLRSRSKTSCRIFVAMMGGVFVCVVSTFSLLIWVFRY